MFNLAMARPQLSSEAVDAMRQRLVDAALIIYREKGLEALSFRSLADAVGLSHTLAYRYFADKEALLTALRLDCTRRFEAFVRKREAVHAPLPQRVRSIAMGYVDFARKYPDEYLLIFSTHQPSPANYPELLAARRSLFEHAVEAVAEGIASGELHGDAREIAHAFWISLHGMMTLHVANQLVHGLRLEQLVKPIIARLLATTPQHKTRVAAAHPSRRAPKSVRARR